MGSVCGACINGRHHRCKGGGGVPSNEHGQNTVYSCQCEECRNLETIQQLKEAAQ